MDSTVPVVTLEHVHHELDLAEEALERGDTVNALEHITSARAYLDRVPSLGTDEYAYTAFVAADEAIRGARRAVRAEGPDGSPRLRRALLGVRSATTRIKGRA